MARWAIALILCSCGRFGYDLQSDDDAGTSEVVDAAPVQVRERLIIVAAQGTTRSHLVPLLWDPESNLPAKLAQTPLRLSVITNSLLRSVVRVDDNTILVSDGGNPAGVYVSLDPLAEMSPMRITDGTMANAHGACVLPGGNIIAGEFSNLAPNRVAEYAGPLDDLTRVRSVYSTTVVGGVLSLCHAVSDDEIYLVDSDGTTESDTDLVRLTKTGDVWSEVARFDLSEFALGKYGVHNTPVWAFAVLDDAIYSFPSRRSAPHIPNLIRCSLPGLDNCVELGPLPPDVESTPVDPDTIHGAVGVPDTRQLLFTTGRAVYQYDLDTDRYTEIFDLVLDAPLTDGSGQTDPLFKVRHLVVF
jgi:hypothetical protein